MEQYKPFCVVPGSKYGRWKVLGPSGDGDEPYPRISSALFYSSSIFAGDERTKSWRCECAYCGRVFALEGEELDYCERGIEGHDNICLCAQDLAVRQNIKVDTRTIYLEAAKLKNLSWKGPSSEVEWNRITSGFSTETSWECLQAHHCFQATLKQVQNRNGCPLCKRVRKPTNAGYKRVRYSFKGTCQLCGQLCPIDEKTSLVGEHEHGRPWDFLSGRCEGSLNIPFEHDTRMIPAMIASQQAEVTRLRNLAARIRKAPGDLVPREILDPERSHEHWDTFEVNEANRPIWQTETRTSIQAEAIDQYREQRVSLLEVAARPRAAYVVWQARRLKEWRSSDLIPKQELEAIKSCNRAKTLAVWEASKEALAEEDVQTDEMISDAISLAERGFQRGDNCLYLWTGHAAGGIVQDLAEFRKLLQSLRDTGRVLVACARCQRDMRFCPCARGGMSDEELASLTQPNDNNSISQFYPTLTDKDACAFAQSIAVDGKEKSRVTILLLAAQEASADFFSKVLKNSTTETRVWLKPLVEEALRKQPELIEFRAKGHPCLFDGDKEIDLWQTVPGDPTEQKTDMSSFFPKSDDESQ